MFNPKIMSLPLLAAVICFSTVTVFGQATRTYVSGVGDDANPCSRTAPCKTFPGAISKTAAGGEIDVLDPGGFGGVTITKSILIEGTPFLAGVLVSGVNGIIVNAPGGTVELRGLTLNGNNSVGTIDGIKVLSAKAVIIENCDIYQFGRRGISIETADTSVVPRIMIRNTRVHSNLSNGITINPGSTSGVQSLVQAIVDNVQIANNVNFGLSVTNGGAVVATSTTITGHGLGGVRVDGTLNATPATVDLDKVVINGSVNPSANSAGILANPNSIARVTNSSIVENDIGLSLNGGSIYSFGNNSLAGNGSNGTFTSPNIALQ